MEHRYKVNIIHISGVLHKYHIAMASSKILFQAAQPKLTQSIDSCRWFNPIILWKRVYYQSVPYFMCNIINLFDKSMRRQSHSHIMHGLLDSIKYPQNTIIKCY